MCEVKLTEEDLKLAESIERLLASGHIKIGVNVCPEHAQSGDGRWNVTKAYAYVGENYIELDKGSVELIEPV